MAPVPMQSDEYSGNFASSRGLDKVGYHSLEAWGELHLIMYRFSKLKILGQVKTTESEIKTQATMLLIGQNLLGYHIIHMMWWKNVAKSMKMALILFVFFDALNDVRNLETAMKAPKNTCHARQRSYIPQALFMIWDYVKLLKSWRSWAQIHYV